MGYSHLSVSILTISVLFAGVLKTNGQEPQHVIDNRNSNNNNNIRDNNPPLYGTAYISDTSPAGIFRYFAGLDTAARFVNTRDDPRWNGGRITSGSSGYSTYGQRRYPPGLYPRAGGFGGGSPFDIFALKHRILGNLFG